jgi:integrase
LHGRLEKDVDLSSGLLIIRTHTSARKKGPKVVPLLQADIEILRGLPRGFLELRLFRRDKGGGGRRASTPFGYGIFYNYWKAVAANLGNP